MRRSAQDTGRRRAKGPTGPSRPVQALAFLGHRMPGGLGSYGAAFSLWLVSDAAQLAGLLLPAIEGKAAPVEQVGRSLLYVNWPELWSGQEPLPAAVDAPAQLNELLLGLESLVPWPAIVSRPAATPRMLRSELEHRLQGLVRDVAPLGTDARALEGLSEDELPLLLERSGQRLHGRCRMGLLESFGLQCRPLPIGDSLGSTGENQ